MAPQGVMAAALGLAEESAPAVERMSLKPLRPYQSKAIEEARAAYRAGHRSILLVAPTGAGKTRVFSELVVGAVTKGGTALVIAHREELVTQAAKAIMAEGVEHVGIIAAGYRRQHAPVQVASVQTLLAQARKGRAMPEATIVVPDEAHHYAADEWKTVLAGIRTPKGDPPLVIGTTATPERGDGKPMGDMFEVIIPVSSVRELQELGVLVPCVTYRPEHKTKALAREPIDAYREHGFGERGFVFCVTVAHAEMIAETFRLAGVPAATIHADTPWGLRAARLAAFKSQDPTPLRRVGSPEDAPLVLCNVYTLTEGVDVPEASVCILARGCGHDGMLVQMVGRVGRAAPWAGKERCIVWDLRGVTHKLGLWEASREYSLEGKAMAAKSETYDPPRRCKACQAIFMSWRIDGATGDRSCPACGEAAPAIEIPDVVEREVFAAGSGASMADQMAAIDRIAMTAADRGYRSGWVTMRYTEHFGTPPPRGSVDAAMLKARKSLGITISDGEVEAERAKLYKIAQEKRIPLSWVEKKILEKFGENAV